MRSKGYIPGGLWIVLLVVVLVYLSYQYGDLGSMYEAIQAVQGLLPAIVAALLALIANAYLQARRTRSDRMISEARTRTEAESAALQTYLDSVEVITGGKTLGELGGSDDLALPLLQARTFTIMLLLSGDLKRVPLTLLYEFGLLD